MTAAQPCTSPTDQLLAYIGEQVARYKSAYNLSTGKAFMMWYGVEAIRLSEDAAYEAASYDGGNDKSVDFFYVDDENNRIVIAQGKYSGQGRYTPSTGEFYNLVHTTDWLNNPESFEREGRSDLAEAARSFLEATEKGYATDLQFVYMGPPHRDVAAALDTTNNQNLTTIPPKSCRVIHLDGLLQVHEDYINADTRIGTATIRLGPSETFEQHGAYGKALTATVPGTELQQLYSAHGDSLFDRNVRVFLGTRAGSVNAGIRDTLTSQHERRNFWAYNNGITFICDRYEFDQKTGQLTIHNFSIVNGCQTTVSVANGPSPAPPEVAIMTRFIAASDEQVVDNIIRFTNSQTPIRPWDIASQDSVQKRLKREFAEAPNPFFYELRRGETGHLSVDDKRQFTRHGKFHVIKPEDLAQSLASLKGMPIDAYKYKAGLFSTLRERVFPADLQIEEAILAWQAGEAAQEAVRAAIVRATERGEEQRVRILKRGAKLFTVAVIGIVLAERNGATYLNRINREVASSRATRQRLDKYAVISVEWYIQAMLALMESGTEFNVLIRNRDTFSRIRSNVLSAWTVYSQSPVWVDDALPRF